MGKFAKLLTESALNSIKGSFNAANNMLQSFSLTDMGKAIDEAQERFKNEFNRFVGQIKNYTDRYTIEIPFNPKIEVISFSIDDSTMNINVRSNDNTSTSNRVITLPDDVDPQEMSQSYDSEKHVMVLKFKKLR